MTGRRILYSLGLIGSLIFYGAYQQWFSWIVLLTAFLFPWLSLALSLPDLIGFRLEPSAASRIPMESTEKIQLKPYSKRLLPPLKSKIHIRKPLTGETWLLRPGDALPTDHCGGLVASLHRPRVYDHLGLFRFRIRNTSDRVFLVLPKPVSMEIPPDLTQYLSRAWRPKPGGGYSETHEIRPYHPGDNLNQIHWKLSAKVGDLMLREPMEPERGLMLLTMDLCGTPGELDFKFARLLWLGNWLLDHKIPFDVRVLTGNGIDNRSIHNEWDLRDCIEGLLCAPFSPGGSIRDRHFQAAWRYHIGGESNEA